jgi:hypothetical protein
MVAKTIAGDRPEAKSAGGWMSLAAGLGQRVVISF